MLETAKGLENLKRQWGVHAAGVIMSSEPLVDIVPIMRRPQDGAIITQFDQPGSEALGLIKMDFLGLRNLTILDDALENIEMNGKPADQDRGGPARRPGDVRAARSRRHPGRVPARRRAHAVAAAPDAPRQLRGHLGRHRAVPPGPDGDELPHQLRAAQERPAEGRAHPPRARGAARGGRGHHPRADRLPGAGAARRAEARRVHARPGRPAASRDGQEEEGGPGQGVRPVPGRHARARLLGRLHPGRLGRAGAVRRVRLQQGALRGVRRHLLLDRLPQGELPDRVHGRAAHQRARRQGQVGAVPGRVPAHGHHGARRRT